MRRTGFVVVLMMAAALLWTAPAIAQDEPATEAEPVAVEVVPMEIELTGATVQPEAGPEDATGSLTLTFDAARNQVCFGFDAEGVEIGSAHIHSGAEGEAGPVVLGLVDDGGELGGCVDADAEVIDEILANPANYYVQAHNEAYPAGVVRGQLGEM